MSCIHARRKGSTKVGAVGAEGVSDGARAVTMEIRDCRSHECCIYLYGLVS